MDQPTLREQWKANNHRPVWVREHREEIHEHTDTSDPIPDKGPFHVRQWLERYRSVVTKQLRADDEGESE